MSKNERYLACIGGVILGYLVLGDYIMPDKLKPTRLLTKDDTSINQSAPFTRNISAQANAFCIELMTTRYNRVDVYQMLSSGMQTHLIDQHKHWSKSGGVSQTPSCVIVNRSRLKDGLYQALGNWGENLFGSMMNASVLNHALERCVYQAKSNC